LRKELSDEANLNLQRYRKAATRRAECLNVNALEFKFPNEKMVLYFFNPFSDLILRAVLQNLGRSLRSNFRDVVVVLDMPLYANVADDMPHLSFVKEGYWYRMYRSKISQAAESAA
jgi:hypothetical protein